MGQDDEPAFVADFRAAVGAFVSVGGGPGACYAGGEFEPPVLAQPPGTAGEESCAEGIALEPVIAQDGVEAERKVDGAYVVVQVEKVGAEEPVVIDPFRPPAEFGGQKAVAPFERILDVVVPGEPARPGLEPDGESQGGVLPESDVETEVGSRSAGIKKIAAQGKALPHAFGGVSTQCIRFEANREGVFAEGRDASA